MDLHVHFPLNDQLVQLPSSISNEQEALDFLEKIDRTQNRSLSFFDEVISGFIILKKNKGGKSQQDEIDHELLALSTTISIDLSIQSSDFTKFSRERLQLNFFNVSNETNLIYNDTVLGTPTLIWNFDIPVNYPRKKILQPKIIINIALIIQQIKTSSSTPKEQTDAGFIDNNRNLLEGIVSRTFDSEVADPHLPESLITGKVEDESEKDRFSPQQHTITLKAKFSLPVYPILTMRLKSAKLAGHSETNSILLTLELSSSKDVFKVENLSVLVARIEIMLKDGKVVELFDKSLTENLIFKNKSDSIHLTYKLLSHSNLNDELLKPLNITIIAIPRILNDNNEVVKLTSEIKMKWMTSIGFEQLTPSTSINIKNKKKLKQTQHQQQLQNSSAQSLSLSQRKSELKLSLKQQPAIPSGPGNGSGSQSQSQTQMSNLLSGLKFTVFGRNKVKLGEFFKLTLQIINSSNRASKLLILLNNNAYSSDIMLEKKFPRIPNTLLKSRSTMSLNSASRESSSIIQSQMNLIRQYNVSKLKASGIICMNNELRIENLEPQTLIDIKFDVMAIQKGIYNLDGVKIINLNSGEHYECGHLLQISVD